MVRSAASYGEAVLHKSPFQTCPAEALAKEDEAAPVFILLRRGKPFHSAMKHSLSLVLKNPLPSQKSLSLQLPGLVTI